MPHVPRFDDLSVHWIGEEAKASTLVDPPHPERCLNVPIGGTHIAQAAGNVRPPGIGTTVLGPVLKIARLEYSVS